MNDTKSAISVFAEQRMADLSFIKLVFPFTNGSEETVMM